MSKEAMKLALEAFKDLEKHRFLHYPKVVKALEEALAKQEQGEPYGYVDAKGGGLFIYGEHQFQNTKNVELVPVYLHPKQEQGEPVLWASPNTIEFVQNHHLVGTYLSRRFIEGEYTIPLYTTPPAKQEQEPVFTYEQVKAHIQVAMMSNISPQRTWVGLTWNDVPDEWVGKVAFMEGAKWADKQLKEKNT
jgi:hypothetical protein